MKNTLKIRFLSMYFHSIMKPEYRSKSVSRKQVKNIAKEQKKITLRAGEMSDGKLISSYIMAIYFIAMNRKSGLDAEENYEILAKAISSSKLLKSTMGNSDSYLDDKKLPGRLQWAEESKKRTQKNNWVVEVLPGCDEYDLGYDYYSIVFQDVTLFNNSVMENIRIGKSGASDEEVMEAARLANCEEFVNMLPDKYDTYIGENGSELSGGERQRISIARAFLKDAPIILLDEATASLDAENETAIQEALSRLIKNKTVMIIAHRMRTIANADHIVVLKDGVVAEQGSPEYLSSFDSIYSRMTKQQMKSLNWKM